MVSEKEQQRKEVDVATEEFVEEQAAEEIANDAEGAEEAADDARYAELLGQVEDYKGRFMRAQADFDNFRRRTLKEKEDLAQYASMKLITGLLPVIDNFDRAMAAASVNSEFEALAKGLDMIFRQLSQVLEQEGLEAMQTQGLPFNPEFHQAVMQVESDEYEEGIVVEEIQKGYILKEKVLRPAMVKVSG